MTATIRATKLPRLEEVTLESFSLYRLRPSLTIPMHGGVFCLAGANGLGKSSFIAALNYALTGGVAPASGKVEQLSKYRRDATAYSTKYFTGRISEADRKSASVGLKFKIGDDTYEIKRRFFVPHELEFLKIVGADGAVLLENDQAQDAEERQLEYETRLCADSGLTTFAQFMFLQHFVFSFDEHRHLLFWDARATELVLYLALGLDPNLAKEVDDLRKAANAAGSLARNAQYQATIARNERNQLVAELEKATGTDAAVVDQYRDLQTTRETLTKERDALRTDLHDARLEFAEASALQMQRRQEYEDAFRQRLGGGQIKGLHALVALTLSDHLCRVCGTQHEGGPASVAAAVEAKHCPMCDASLQSDAPAAADLRDELVRLDAELSLAAEKCVSLNQTIVRLDAESRTKQQELAAIINQLTRLEETHSLSPNADASADETALRDRVAQLENAMEVALGRKEEQLELRDAALKSYEPIQAALKSAWTAAEVEFVPRFRSLAEEFIGLPLQVTLDAGSTIYGNAHLTLAVNSTHRRQSEQLSESQRFFLDIALRMSLTQHMTAGTEGSCIYVDTPEGALDIAYEARAGDMFASFTSGGDQVIMTANVNTSKLLTRMAERCGRARMQFVRMTEWTELSGVQVEANDLFEQAFAEIEHALDRGPQAATTGGSERAGTAGPA